MSGKFAVLCFALLLGAPPVASAQNLVDPPEGRHPSSDGGGGSIFNLFSSFRSRGTSPSDSDDHGCEPIINAAGNAVRRPGCP